MSKVERFDRNTHRARKARRKKYWARCLFKLLFPGGVEYGFAVMDPEAKILINVE